MKLVCGVLGAALVLMGAAGAQTSEKPAAVSQDPYGHVDPRPLQSFHLANVSSQNDANEIVVAVRNLLDPNVKIYLVPSQNTIVMRGSNEQIALAQKMVDELDRPKKSYRLTYTITELDGGKRVGVQHFAMIVTSGQRTQVKQGSRVPIITESDKGDTQVQYIDIGLNFDSTLDQYASGAKLSTKVEQTSVAEEKSAVVPQDPVVRQTLLANTSFLLPGKPVVLGSVDVAGSMRHMDIDVMMEPIVP
ncbi:MAG TPA: secretin N-terminal domain-containing protein [Edaphobacter sp.]|jgi:type II secretory pathway component GspD/PulD (secretin)|nr:secretin N-terminal domain-containing protein [Edaphobacter sp.]